MSSNLNRLSSHLVCLSHMLTWPGTSCKQFYCVFKRNVNAFLQLEKSCSIAHFWTPYRTKYPGDQILIGHSVPDEAKRVGHQTCRKLNPWLCINHEKVKFTSLVIIPETAAVEWVLIMKLLLVQLCSLQKYDVLWHFTLYTWPLTSAKTQCPCSPNELFSTSVFSTDPRLEFGG